MRRTKSALASLLAVGALAGVLAPNAAADSSCNNGQLCVWTQGGFEGAKRTFAVSDAYLVLPLGNFDRSAKNRFANRWVSVYRDNGTYLTCILPGVNNSNLPQDADKMVIGGQGTGCP